MTLRSYKRLPRPERYFSGALVISLATFYFGLLSVAGYGWGQQGFMAWILISLSVVYPRIVIRDKDGSVLNTRRHAAIPVSHNNVVAVPGTGEKWSTSRRSESCQ
jgi:hypothetical protein